MIAPPTPPLTPAERLAKALSDVLSPPLLAAPGLLLAAGANGFAQSWAAATTYFAVAIVLPLGYLFFLVYSGRVADVHLPRRRDRFLPLAVAAGCSTAAMAWIAALQPPPGMWRFLEGLWLQTALLLVVTFWWQISLHMAAIAGLAAYGTILFADTYWQPTVVGLGLVLSLVVAWARLHIRRHTPRQVLAGAALGAGAMWWAAG